MTIRPVFIDSRPAYLATGTRGASLLRMPLGSATLLHKLHGLVSDFARGPAAIWSPEASDDGSKRHDSPGAGPLDDFTITTRFGDLVEQCEPSDWLLIMEAACFPASELPLRELREATHDPRRVAHVVCAEDGDESVQERVAVNSDGSVQRIWRSYAGVTSFGSPTVTCSMVSGAVARMGVSQPFKSLSELYRLLASNGIPSQDLLLSGGCFDLSQERDLLALNERTVIETVRPMGLRSAHASHRETWQGQRCRVHRSARLLGPVVLQDDVCIEAGATVIGPATLGAGSRVRSGAIAAQCLLTLGATVPERSMLRHRVVTGGNCSPLPQRPPGALSLIGRGRVVAAGRGRGVDYGEQQVQHARRYPALKCIVDMCCAIAALALLSPLLLVAALLIKLESRGPVLYADMREGRGGRRFRCWKFRSMVLGADAQQRALSDESHVDGPQFKIKNDPRITRVGRWMRSTNIDELPQLINVALCQMSLIGPRPSPFRENQICVPWRQARLSVRPGITGLWQICRHDREIGDFHQWIHYDMLYVRHLSAWLDVKILLATLFTMGGRWSVRLSWFINDRDMRDDVLDLVPSRLPLLELSNLESTATCQPA